jgi:hypothetical protein
MAVSRMVAGERMQVRVVRRQTRGSMVVNQMR